MSRILPITLGLIWLSPLVAYAGVSISEIAWMGSNISASNEWIELRNDADQAVSLDGWLLKAKDGSPSITLSGTISPLGYYLIERTDDETVPEVEADLVTSFGKGLSNEGETLELRDGSATVVDTVKGGTNWKNIGGDGKTKFTPQKRGGLWVTTKATPRSAPLLPSSPVPVPAPAPQAPSPQIESTLPSVPIVKEKTPDESSVATTAPTSTTEHVSRESSAPLLERIYGEDPSPTSGTKRFSTTLPLLGTLLLFGSSAVVYLRGRSKTEAEKYEIIEDESEDLV